ncbi:Ig-like domain-containing protein [Rossellomorea vietnamensis]|uniref:Ig-like domain-containing protein n=1 Tax=Rossellomorea vietnamensis TaxID=218284 RepID=UPI001E5EFCA4|nr:Ig-like domain-containing protein [Rossellomorea vietnamensis]MCC5804670.1 Ig-like domain-containing protein [Rossellomorea vietnamensis]
MFKVVSQTVSEVVDKDPNLYVQRAEDYLKKSRFSDALDEMDKAISYSSNNKNFYIFEKVKIFEAIGVSPTCVPFIKSHLSSLYFYLSLADFYRVLILLEKNLQKGSQDVVQILSSNNIPVVLTELYRIHHNTSREFFLECAEEYRKKKIFSFAHECIEVIHDKYGEGVDSCLLNARITKDQGDLKEALKYYVRTSNLSGATVEVYLEIVELQLFLKQEHDAMRWIDAGLKKFPSHIEFLHQKVEILYRKNSHDECLNILNAILSVASRDSKAIYLKGLIYDQKKEYIKSNWYLKKAQRINEKLLPPSNKAREQFIFRFKSFMISLTIILLVVVSGQYVMYASGMIKPYIKSASLWASNDEMIVGQSLELEKSIDYFPSYAQNPDARIKVKDPDIALLYSNGKLEGLKEGTTTVQLVVGDKVLDSREVRIINPEIEAFKVDLGNNLLEVGDSTNVSTTIIMDHPDGDIPDIAYSSSDQNVVEISNEGEILAVGVGEAVINIIAGEQTKTEKIIVKAKLNEIIFDSTEISIEIGETLKLEPTLITTPPDEDSLPLIYESSDSEIVTVDSKGEMKALDYGESEITISSPSGIENTIMVSVKPKNISGLTAQYNDNSQIIILEWDYVNESDEDVNFFVEVDENGTFTPLTSTNKNGLNVENVTPETQYTFRVKAVIGNRESKVETISVYTSSEKVAAMEKLVGYWKRTDKLSNNKTHDNRYIFIYGDSGTYWRMDFQSEYGGNREMDTTINEVSLDEDEIQANQVHYTFTSDNEVTVKYQNGGGFGGVTNDEQGYVTEHFEKVSKNEVESMYLDRYPYTELPE